MRLRSRRCRGARCREVADGLVVEDETLVWCVVADGERRSVAPLGRPVEVQRCWKLGDLLLPGVIPEGEGEREVVDEGRRGGAAVQLSSNLLAAELEDDRWTRFPAVRRWGGENRSR